MKEKLATVVTRKYHFYAAHRNMSAGEKCSRIHGHTYHVEVSFAMRPVDGITMLFDEIDKSVEPIVKQFDHWLILWDKDPLCKVLDNAGEKYAKVGFKTSAENLAKFFFEEIEKWNEAVWIVQVKETESSIINYIGE